MVNKLKKNNLGSTNIKVSSLCFGTLTVSPLQCNFTSESAADLFVYAIDRGINFFDTAALYDTYIPLKKAVKYKNDIVIATKDYCYDEKTAEKSLHTALKGIGRDYVDIFLLHEQESIHTIRGHFEAIEYLIKRKEKGEIGAIGLSTHFVAAVEAASLVPEIEVIHPIYNSRGLGIADGSKAEMGEAIKALIDKDKGIYLMKALGGGHLISEAGAAFREVLDLRGISSIAVGMKSTEEVDYNISVFSGAEPENEIKDRLDKTQRRLYIHDWCSGCGKCITACDKGALSLENGKAKVDMSKCVLCGYCAARCRDFCIKVI